MYEKIILEELLGKEIKDREDFKVFLFLSAVKRNNRRENKQLKDFCNKHVIDFRLTKNNLITHLSTFKRAEVWNNNALSKL